MLTPEELRLRTRKRRRLMILLVIALLLAPVVFFAARPTRDAIKGWQARRHAQKAFAAIEAQHWDDARTEAVAAYQLRSTEPEALRAVARLLSRTRQPQALEFWEQLSKTQTLTREDLRDEAAVALVAGEIERATGVVKSMLERKDAAAAEWLIAAQLDLQKGNREQAQDYLQKILGRDLEQITRAIAGSRRPPGARDGQGCAQRATPHRGDRAIAQTRRGQG